MSGDTRYFIPTDLYWGSLLFYLPMKNFVHEYVPFNLHLIVENKRVTFSGGLLLGPRKRVPLCVYELGNS